MQLSAIVQYGSWIVTEACVCKVPLCCVNSASVSVCKQAAATPFGSHCAEQHSRVCMDWVRTTEWVPGVLPTYY